MSGQAGLRGQVAAMLAAVDSHELKRVGEIIDRARSAARGIVAEARRNARLRVREAVARERTRMNQAIGRAEAGRQTRARLDQQVQTLRCLQEGWRQLPALLKARWRDARARRLWCEAVALRAARLLPPGEWTVEHPSDWRDEDAEHMRAVLRKATNATLRFECCAELQAGLRLWHGGTCLDAGVEGLLANREAVDGQLLAALPAAVGQVARRG